MFTKTLLALSAVSMVALPTAANAGHRSYNDGYVDNGYYGGSYDQGYYDDGSNDRYYGSRGYDSRYDNRNYRQRCGKGTTGLIVGGAAGALLGREVGRSRDRSGYRRGSGTTGAVIGGALGALIGKKVAKRC